MGIILTIIAATLSIIIYPFALVYSLFRYTKFSYLFKHYFNIAVSIDQTGNVVCQYPLNDFMIKKGGIKFGNPDETISGVLGKNKEINKLTILGKALSKFLNEREDKHVENAIEKDERNEIK
jgi:hypothetical protein